MKRLYYILGLAILVLLSLTVLSVQPVRAEDEPAPGVARVSLIHGDVSTMRGDSGDWVASTVNAPVVQGDKITTGDRSQAEVQLDYANIVRLAAGTEVKIADLARTRIQVQVAQGLVNFSVLKGSEADVEIDTPNMAVRPLREGSYRIQVNSASETQLIVRNGEAEVSTPQGNTVVKKDHAITVRGTDNPEYQTAEAPGRDDWDKWNKERDSEIGDARSWQYANHYYTGTQDLDRNGHWTQVPGYDWCWTPYVNRGWVPYRDGSWTWEPYWGWTWVSYEPWGWAPYHYGRWFSYNDDWYWWPGHNSYGYYPTWAPAYVSFLGFGFGGHNWHFGFGFGFGSIGWLPLGPYDHYSPWWGRHNSYNVVNITNITNVTNVIGDRGRGHIGNISNVEAALTNARVRGAITSVSTDDFVRGRVPRNPQAVDEATLRGGQVIRGTLPAVPTRESLRPTDRPVNTAALARGSNRSENFFTRRQPPAGPQSFTEQAAGIQRMVERPNSLQAAERGTPASATRAAANRPEPGQTQRLAPTGAAPTQGRGWQRFGQPGATGVERGNAAPGATAPRELAQRGGTGQTGQRTQAQPAQQPSQQPSRGTWQRFGTGQPRAVPGRPTTTGAPRGTQAAPARRGEDQGGSRQSTPQAQPAPSGRAFTRSAPATESSGSAQPGWNRFSPRPESSAGTGNESRFSPAPRSQTSAPSRGENPAFGQAPRSYERAPLQLRNPIVTERAPRASGGGAPRSWSAPSGGNRSWSAPSGGGRSSSAPSGGGRSTVAPPSRSSGGGGRGWSAPSGGGGGRSAPAPARAPSQSGSRGRH
jgi:hypothetical protein